MALGSGNAPPGVPGGARPSLVVGGIVLRPIEGLQLVLRGGDHDLGDGYVYAVALHSTGHIAEAITELKDTLARHPNDHDTLLALISFSRESGEDGAALEYAGRLARIAPQDRGLAALIEELRRTTGRPDADRSGPPPGLEIGNHAKRQLSRMPSHHRNTRRIWSFILLSALSLDCVRLFAEFAMQEKTIFGAKTWNRKSRAAKAISARTVY